ncbi:hypothetical protein BCT53_03905 [Vibrio lentus]|uniref:hypothetical protein n=1 Tax=Vibrio lentus TaxID=136468 RepID=UPI000C83E271|nr:hypothetical protein [Vibrio lentus]PMM48114.1 hypothetical protein BCT53_03905 [Vibrio lentus]
MIEYDNYLSDVLIAESNDTYDLYDKFNAAECPLGLRELCRGRYQHKVRTQASNDFIKWLTDSVLNYENRAKNKLESYFFLIEKISSPMCFWRNILCTSKQIAPLIQDSVNIIQSLKSDIQEPFISDYHREKLILEFQSLGNCGDWAKVHEKTFHSAPYFKHSINYLLSNALAILYVHSKEKLIECLEDKKDIPLIWGLMSHAGVDVTLDIAHSTESHSLLFCCYASLLSQHKEQSFSQDQDCSFTSLLEKTASSEFFSHVLNIVARYPSRYPNIQDLLGSALAKSKNSDAITQYLGSIGLRSIEFNDPCRKIVAKCLTAFANDASIEHQRVAWKAAYHIWFDWKFDISNKDDVYLFETKASALDYAIVRYFLDCCSTEDRKKFVDERLEGLNIISEAWYESQTDLKSHWNLELSLLQPVFQANEIIRSPSQPYLMVDRFYSLETIQNNQYIQAYIN